MTKTRWIQTLFFMAVPFLLVAGTFLSGTRADDPSAVSMSVEPDISQTWPQFRGTNAAGVATGQD
ncbi:MAG: hypothetical protein ACERK6_08395, partial [Candidatus Aminicenantaceae bacterium]